MEVCSNAEGVLRQTQAKMHDQRQAACLLVENYSNSRQVDRQGHSCNFYAGLGPTDLVSGMPLPSVLWRLSMPEDSLEAEGPS